MVPGQYSFLFHPLLAKSRYVVRHSANTCTIHDSQHTTAVRKTIRCSNDYRTSNSLHDHALRMVGALLGTHESEVKMPER